MKSEKEKLTPISEKELAEKLKEIPLSYQNQEPSVIHLNSALPVYGWLQKNKHIIPRPLSLGILFPLREDPL